MKKFIKIRMTKQDHQLIDKTQRNEDSRRENNRNGKVKETQTLKRRLR